MIIIFKNDKQSLKDINYLLQFIKDNVNPDFDYKGDFFNEYVKHDRSCPSRYDGFMIRLIGEHDTILKDENQIYKVKSFRWDYVISFSSIISLFNNDTIWLKDVIFSLSKFIINHNKIENHFNSAKKKFAENIGFDYDSNNELFFPALIKYLDNLHKDIWNKDQIYLPQISVSKNPVDKEYWHSIKINNNEQWYLIPTTNKEDLISINNIFNYDGNIGALSAHAGKFACRSYLTALAIAWFYPVELFMEMYKHCTLISKINSFEYPTKIKRIWFHK